MTQSVNSRWVSAGRDCSIPEHWAIIIITGVAPTAGEGELIRKKKRFALLDHLSSPENKEQTNKWVSYHVNKLSNHRHTSECMFLRQYIHASLTGSSFPGRGERCLPVPSQPPAGGWTGADCITAMGFCSSSLSPSPPAPVYFTITTRGQRKHWPWMRMFRPPRVTARERTARCSCPF